MYDYTFENFLNSSSKNIDLMLEENLKKFSQMKMPKDKLYDYLALIKYESRKFNDYIHAMMTIQSKLAQGSIDTKRAQIRLKTIKKLLKKNCKFLKININYFKNSKGKITLVEVRKYAKYIANIERILKEKIKKFK